LKVLSGDKRRQFTGLLAGIAVFTAVLVLPPVDSFRETAARLIQTSGADLSPDQLTESMRAVLAVMGLMVVWWVTEAVPLPVTALVPVGILPLLHIEGVTRAGAVDLTLRTVAQNYANPVIFLFLGGFLIAGAMRKWGLDRRLTLWLLSRGNLAYDARKILFAMMAVTSVLSMWISNTATAALMLPIGLSVLSLMGERPDSSRFGTAVMLGIGWAASVGGMGTIIGTPPNGIALGILNTVLADDPSYERITFLDWITFGVPYVILFLPVVWFLLIKLFPPTSLRVEGGKEHLLAEYRALGRFSRGEKWTVAVFVLAAALWVVLPFREQILPAAAAEQLAWFDEYSVGIFAGLLMFLLPVNARRGEFVLTWSDTKYVQWGILVLFGGGIALSDALFKTGLASWFASSFVAVFGSPSTILLMFVVVFLVDFLTEITSNTAVTSMIVPIIISIALETGENPVALVIAAALAGSMAFMLPVATPPNAIVYSSGYIKLKDMIRAGFVLDILGWVFTVGVVLLFAGLIFGIV
jgi:sodium-dependent dicarboxylate transporter 2/3/5